jgi:hypothetical protein
MKSKLYLAIAAIAVLLVGISAYEHYSLPRRGERAFARLGCGGCHSTGAGPNLTHVIRKRDPALLEQLIANPREVYRQRHMRPLNEGYMLMPDMHASRRDAMAIVAFFRELDEQ